MRKSVLLLIFTFLISLIGVNALNYTYSFITNSDIYCYQETANLSTSCGGLNTGKYNTTGSWILYNEAYDGVWTTKGYANTGTAYLYINYTIPQSTYLNNSIWTIGNHNTTTDSFIISNVSLSKCANISNNLVFRVESVNTLNHWVNWTCNNGSNWVQLNYSNYTFATPYIYEEAVWWNLINRSINKSLNYSLSNPQGYLNYVSVLSLNISIDVNQSYPSVFLVYNGTNYSQASYTDFGSYRVYSQTVNNVLNGSVSYYWNVTLNDTSQLFNFNLSGTHVVTTQNLTIFVYNEVTNLKINDVAFVTLEHDTETTNYSMGGGQVNITGLSAYNYTININAQPNYTGKQYYLSVLDSGSYTLNARLTPTSSSCNSTFEIRDGSNNILSDVTITMQRAYSGSYATINQKTTDISGRASFTIENNQNYKFIISGTGYSTKEFFLIPVCSQTYTIFITESDGVYTNVFDDVEYYYFPTNTSLNGGNYNFGISTISTSGILTYTTTICNQTIISNVTSAGGGTAQISQDLTGFDGIWTCSYKFKATGFDEVSTTINYNIRTNQPVQNVTIQDMTNRAKTEFSNSWMAILGIFIVLAVTITIFYLTNGNTIASTFTALGMIGLMAGIGWFELTISVIIIFIVGMTFFFRGDW